MRARAKQQDEVVLGAVLFYPLVLVFAGGTAGALFTLLGFGPPAALAEAEGHEYLKLPLMVLGAVLASWSVLMLLLVSGPLRAGQSFLVRYGSNPYAPLESWVISSSLKPTDAHLPGVSLSSSVSPDAMAFLTRLKERHPRRVWLVGGGHIAKQALLADRLDEMVLTIIPKCIGAGVPLFQGQIALEKNWALIQAGATENGAAQLLYRRRPG